MGAMPEQRRPSDAVPKLHRPDARPAW